MASLPLDALEEFRIISNNYAAEYGHSTGGIVALSTRSGTNQVHGAAWEFNRDTALAANTWANNLVGTKKVPVKWNQPGATFGGPLIKDKVFYFGDFEAFLHRDRLD